MILIVDDDISVRTSLTLLLTRAGLEPLAVPSPAEAMETVRNTVPRLILLDMNFSPGTAGQEGICLLRQIKIFCPRVPVILMTAWGSIQLAVDGMKAGAFDFITKPWHNAVLLQTIRTALELSENNLDPDKQEPGRFEKIIGKSKLLLQVFDTVERIAPTDASVLITGESGTGKELIAGAIHANSLRRMGPFVKVNLGGLSQSLFESEMFGHKKGAFTDAYSDRTGRFEMADKGTIFLDEIGELNVGCQVKLLRVLQDRTFEVLGDSRMRKADVRVVSATNRDLSRMVAERSFREDLFYRINLIPIHLPPLRERREDIPLLAAYFAGNCRESERNIRMRKEGLCGKNTGGGDKEAVDFTPAAVSYLQSLPYPGNIRELKNLVERTILISGKQVLDKKDFEMQYKLSGSGGVSALNAEGTLEEMESRRIKILLSRPEATISSVAKILGISRAALYRRMEKYGIEPEQK